MADTNLLITGGNHDNTCAGHSKHKKVLVWGLGGVVFSRIKKLRAEKNI